MCGGWTCTSVQCIPLLFPLLTSTPGVAPQSDGSSTTILSQKVYGELVILMSPVRNLSVECCTFSADRPGYLMLFRKHVSRKAADKGRAVLEGVGLDAPTIQTCYMDHPQKVEEAIHTGLTKWSGGQGLPATWEVLLAAMEYAEIAEKDIQDLKMALGL